MSMEVRKESNGLKNSMVTREELAIINQFTKRALKEDEVYTFAELFGARAGEDGAHRGENVRDAAAFGPRDALAAARDRAA